MCDPQNLPNWNKLRFRWKSDILESQDLSRGAKQMSVVLCDIYANRTTGKCWPGNVLLAKKLGVTVRSIQRYCSELLDAGWIQIVPISGKRRGIQLEFPSVLKNDNKDDKTSTAHRQKLSSKHDNSVVLYNKKEPSKNQSNGKLGKVRFAVVSISATETQSLDEWVGWIAENSDYEISKLFESLRVAGKYNFPCRFPEATTECKTRYLRYFDAVSDRRTGL